MFNDIIYRCNKRHNYRMICLYDHLYNRIILLEDIAHSRASCYIWHVFTRNLSP